MRPIIGVAAILGATLLVANLLLAQSDKPQKELADTIASLGSDDEDISTAARQKLLSMGKAALPALEDAAKTGDNQHREAAQAVIGDIKLGITANMDQDMVDRLHDFAKADGDERLRLASNFGNFGDALVDNVLLLRDAETDEEVRKRLDGYLFQYAHATIHGMLLRGEVERAEKFMAEGSAQCGDVLHEWVAYSVLTNRYQQERAKVQADLAAETSEDQRQMIANKLAYLQRAAGDLKGALATAREAHFPSLVFSLLVEDAQWHELIAPETELDFAGGRPQARHAAQTLAALFAGDNTKYEQLLADLPNQLGRDSYWDDHYPEILLALHQPDQAVKVYTDRKKWSQALAILRNRSLLVEALALIERAAADNPLELHHLQLDRAEILIQLGEKEQGTKALNDLTGELQDQLRSMEEQMRDPSPEDRARHEPDWEFDHAVGGAAALWRHIGQEQKCWELAARYIEVVHPGPNVHEGMFDPLFSSDSHPEWLASMLWQIWPKMPAPELLKKVQAISDGKMDPAEMEEIFKRIDQTLEDQEQNAQQDETDNRTPWLKSLLLETLEKKGMEGDLSRKLWKELSEKNPALLRETLFHRTRIAANAKNWAAVASVYQQLADQGEGDWPRCLAGYALVQAGKKSEGESLMHQSQLLMLASQRNSLSSEARAMGFKDLAAEQDKLSLGFSLPHDWEWVRAARTLGLESPLKPGDAATMLEKYLVSATTSANEPPYQPLQVAAKLHVLKAIAAAEQKQWGTVEQEMIWAQTLYPILDTDELLEVVGPVDAAGGKHVADQMVKRQTEKMEELLAKFPASSEFHNNLAWILARSGRDLNTALRHAETAVQLEPQSPALIDTLAEVHFARGEAKEAVALEKQALSFTPDSQVHKDQLAKFEKAAADAQSPSLQTNH